MRPRSRFPAAFPKQQRRRQVKLRRLRIDERPDGVKEPLHLRRRYEFTEPFLEISAFRQR